jgi:hypothetical protein
MATLGNNELQARFKSGTPRFMHLNVTRQNQEFDINHDLIHCDVELLYAQAKLVGEPGLGGSGITTGYTQAAEPANGASPWKITVNHSGNLNDPADTNKVLGVEENFIQEFEVDHSLVDLEIEGLTERRQFLKDPSIQSNDLHVLVPTDFGLEIHRNRAGGTSYMPWFAENVKLNPRLKIKTYHPGPREKSKRICRFVQDFADTNTATYRKANGELKPWATQGHSSGTVCQFPANCVVNIQLTFRITPRVLL